MTLIVKRMAPIVLAIFICPWMSLIPRG